MFSSYVNKLYNMKSHPNNVTQKLLGKSLLNNLLGRFGMYCTSYLIKEIIDSYINDFSC